MKKRHFKRLVSFACTIIIVMGISVTTFAEEADTITTTIGETYYFDSPQVISEEEPEVTDHLLFSVEEIEKMTETEFSTILKAETPLDDIEIDQIVSYYHSDNFKQGIAPAYGVYDHPTWQIQPYVKSTVKGVTYATSWIGIDAYRSSVGMSKGKQKQRKFLESLVLVGVLKLENLRAT